MMSVTAAYVYGFMERHEYIRRRSTEGETMTGTAETITAYAGWALLEHRQRVGYVTEVEMAGSKMLRIDIPTEGGDVTEFYGGAAVYSLRPASEEVCRDAARGYGDPRPIKPVEYRPQTRLADYARDDDGADDMPI